MEANFLVEGMSCQHCVKAVQQALLALPGVMAVQVDLEGGRVQVQYQEGQVSLAQMKAAVTDQGYEVP